MYSLDGKTLLKAETVDTMLQNNIGNIQPLALATVMPSLSNTADVSFGKRVTLVWDYCFIQTVLMAGEKRMRARGQDCLTRITG